MRARGLKPFELFDPATNIKVAPHAGAWIETLEETEDYSYSMSRPMRARGLKQLIDKKLFEDIIDKMV